MTQHNIPCSRLEISDVEWRLNGIFGSTLNWLENTQITEETSYLLVALVFTGRTV